MPTASFVHNSRGPPSGHESARPDSWPARPSRNRPRHCVHSASRAIGVSRARNQRREFWGTLNRRGPLRFVSGQSRKIPPLGLTMTRREFLYTSSAAAAAGTLPLHRLAAHAELDLSRYIRQDSVRRRELDAMVRYADGGVPYPCSAHERQTCLLFSGKGSFSQTSGS